MSTSFTLFDDRKRQSTPKVPGYKYFYFVFFILYIYYFLFYQACSAFLASLSYTDVSVELLIPPRLVLFLRRLLPSISCIHSSPQNIPLRPSAIILTFVCVLYDRYCTGTRRAYKKIVLFNCTYMYMTCSHMYTLYCYIKITFSCLSISRLGHNNATCLSGAV